MRAACWAPTGQPDLPQTSGLWAPVVRRRMVHHDFARCAPGTRGGASSARGVLSARRLESALPRASSLRALALSRAS